MSRLFNNAYRIKGLIVLLLMAPLLSSCGDSDSAFYTDNGLDCSGADAFSSGQCTLPPPPLPPQCDSNDTGVVDGCGEAITAVDIYDPVTVNVTGLTANALHTIEVTDHTSTAISPVGGYSVNADSAGNIYMATVVQNEVSASGVGTPYTITVKEGGSTVQTYTYTVENRSRVYCSDDLGALKSSFTSAENVYAKIEQGGGTLADGDYNLYVVSDQQNAVPNTGGIPAASQSITVTAGSAIVNLGTFSSGRYDIIVDINGNGAYDRDTDLISRHSRHHPCFAIQAVHADTPQQIASDRQGNSREIFDPDADIEDIRDIFGFLVPSEVPAAANNDFGDLYVVDHQDTWADGNTLTDASAGGVVERNPIQDENNSEAKWMLWGYSGLAAGCYDIVLDNDRDGVYTAGVDYVDNINQLGDNTDCGLRVSIPGCSNTTITSHTHDTITESTAITLEGGISGSPVVSYLTITSGAQSNTLAITVDGSGNYSVPLPLYSGPNHITVTGIFADDTSCSETITITSAVDLALFRAQLTWDGDTDMDLHVVRPGGTYTNTGMGGDGSDCNWTNCKVGLDGVGTNDVSWGDPDNELDDPKLDVDCVACGNGIENIWMTAISEDGAYKVYVDAFDGSETDVTVTIYIVGTAVGQVNCGSMVSDDTTDSCFVGTIHWRGGSSGGGYFVPDGSVAADF